MLRGYHNCFDRHTTAMTSKLSGIPKLMLTSRLKCWKGCMRNAGMSVQFPSTSSVWFRSNMSQLDLATKANVFVKHSAPTSRRRRLPLWPALNRYQNKTVSAYRRRLTLPKKWPAHPYATKTWPAHALNCWDFMHHYLWQSFKTHFNSSTFVITVLFSDISPHYHFSVLLAKHRFPCDSTSSNEGNRISKKLVAIRLLQYIIIK